MLRCFGVCRRTLSSDHRVMGSSAHLLFKMTTGRPNCQIYNIHVPFVTPEFSRALCRPHRTKPPGPALLRNEFSWTADYRAKLLARASADYKVPPAYVRCSVAFASAVPSRLQ